MATGLTFDNYDENTETLSGSGTPHYIVGITYQNIEGVTDDALNVLQNDGDKTVQQPIEASSRKHSYE